MAEAVAVVGLVSSIIQIVDFGSKVVSRLNEFQSSISEVPKTFRDIKIQLPLLINTLKQTQKQADAGHVSEETAKALTPVVDGCLSQVRLLEDILAKALPAKKDSVWNRRFKALSSFIHDGAIQQITVTLERYVQTLTYHQTTQLSKPVPETSQRKPCFMVRFERDPNFIGREDIIEEIDERFKMNQRRVAITGIGGVGKSQIAIEYCYRYRDTHLGDRVFWVHASNSARFEEAYKDIARELALPGLEDPDVDTFQLVIKWLSDDANGPWLMVLDNVDDIEIAFGSSPQISSRQDGQQSETPLVSYLPRNSNSLMIITTRDRRVGERLADRQRPIAVLPFAPADAECLLRYRLPENCKWNEAESAELLEILEFLPLAITQASAFISENEITLVKYLDMLRVDNRSAKGILDKDLFDPWRDLEIRNSVFQTWMLSFDQIRKQKPRAAEILSLMSFLDRQAIPDVLLRNTNEGEIEFITAIGTLKAFSLITEEKKGATFGMHRLVQFSTQVWLELQHMLVEWQGRALEVVSNYCPSDGKYENWTAWRVINPHAQAVLGYAFQSKPCLLKRASILHGEGCYNSVQGQHKVAHSKLIEALEIREKALGHDHTLTLDTVHSLGTLYSKQDKLTEAETMYRRALAGKEKAFGPDHMSTLDSLHSLGTLYSNQDKLTEAEAMYRRALAGREKAFGPDHTSTLDSLHSLGTLYSDQDKLTEAEATYQRALVGKEKALGPDHPSTLDTVHNLGLLYSDQDKLMEAETMCQRALIGYEKVLGPDHTSTLNAVNNLGTLYSKQDKLTEAETLYERALAGFEKVLSPDHTLILAVINNLGLLYSDQGKPAEAEAMYQRALVGCEKVLGPDHTSTLDTAHNLAFLYSMQGKLAEAEALYRRALVGKEKTLGPDHTSTLATVHGLGILYQNQGNQSSQENRVERSL